MLDPIKKNDYSFFIPKLSAPALDDRRQHILSAAEVCFARNGFHRTTIADVKEEAGVSTGAIYTYFENKEAMIRAILTRAREDRRRQLEAAALGGPDGAAQAQVLLEWVSAIFTAPGGHAARVDVNLWAEALRSKRIEGLARGALREATHAVAAVVSARLAEGGAPEIAPEAVATVLIAFFLGLEVQTAVGVRMDPPEVVRVLGTLFADYLPKAPAPKAENRKRRDR